MVLPILERPSGARNGTARSVKIAVVQLPWALAAHDRYVYPGPGGREILRLIEWREGRRYRRDRRRADAVRRIGSGLQEVD